MRGRETEAVEILEQAAAMKERLGETEDEDAIDIYGSLAIALDDAGRLDEAEMINRNAVAASRLMLGDMDPNTLTRIGNLGLIQLRQGNYEEAQRSIEEAYRGINEIWPFDSGSTIWVASIRGNVLQLAGRFDESLAAYEEHRRKSANFFGLNSLRYAKALQRLGQWNLVMGKHREALRLLAQALTTAEETGLDPGSRVGSIRLSLAEAHIADGDYSTAEAIARRELSAADTLGRTTVASLQRELARSLSLQGRYAEATPLFEASLSKREAHSGPTSVSLLPTLLAISKHFRRAGDAVRALPVAQRAHDIGLAVTPPGTWEPAFASAEYALALNATADSGSAQALFEKAISDLVVAFGADDPRIADLRQDFEATIP